MKPEKSDIAGVNITSEFLADLDLAYNNAEVEVAEPSRSDELGLTQEFFSDLEVAYKEAESQIRPELTQEEFDKLGEQLESITNYWRQKVNEKLKEIDEDDPIFCPVSLFGTMDYGRLEVAHTRTLAWLLDPKKEHGFEHALLREFVSFVFNAKFSPDDEQFELPEKFNLEIEAVEAEKVTDKKDRLDLFVKGKIVDGSTLEKKSFIIVVEAKIDAMEGDEQLARYDKFLEKFRDNEIRRVFLTTSGRHDTTSKNELWRPLQFSELAHIFRDSYLKHELKNKHGFHFLRYYLAGIFKDILGFEPISDKTDYNPFLVASYLGMLEGSQNK